MQKTRFLVFLLIAVLLVSFVSARSFWLIRTPERMRHIYFDPTYEKLTSDERYTKPLTGYGLKDISEGYKGFKSATSVTQNLPYNSFIKRGRDPSHISNWDPNMRGYSIMNVYVELEPVENALLAEQGKLLLPGMAAGSARLISNREKVGDEYKTTVSLNVRDLFDIGPTEVYEAWMVDYESEYPLSLGIFGPVSYDRQARLDFEFWHYAHNYDMIMVTKEPYPDPDPNPSEVMLVGNIPETRGSQMPVSQYSYYSKI